MSHYISKNLILALLATLGIATISYGCYSGLLHYFGLTNQASAIASLIIFVALSTPIPPLLLETIHTIKNSQCDELTGLPNRTAFNIKFKQLLDTSEAANKKFHLLILDLDKFKQINDTLGHHFGDMVLKHIASQLHNSIRVDEDIVARLGGDEFAILIPDPDNNDAYEPVIAKIVKAINSPVNIDGHYLYISVSIGVATYPTTSSTSVNLMRFADIAMYSAKKMQRNFYVYNEEFDDSNQLTDLTILGEMRQSIEDGDFETWFQPKKNLINNQIESIECLIRWRHPVRGLLMPNKFIPYAEESGMIRLLTQSVIKSATQSYKLLSEAGYDLDISVNVSPNDIVDPSTMTTIIKNIVKSDMLPEKFVLEVTETAIMHDHDAAFKVLVALESLGIKLSIDDFGTGHSSMTYLKNFPICEVKIDQSFIKEIDKNKESFNIVRSTIELSHSLNAVTVAEGVETKEVEDMLRALHCDHVQGYYIAKPMPLDELILWLNLYYEQQPKGDLTNGK